MHKKITLTDSVGLSRAGAVRQYHYVTIPNDFSDNKNKPRGCADSTDGPKWSGYGGAIPASNRSYASPNDS